METAWGGVGVDGVDYFDNSITSNENRNVLVLITDGKDKSDVYSVQLKAAKLGISVFTIGIGQGAVCLQINL